MSIFYNTVPTIHFGAHTILLDKVPEGKLKVEYQSDVTYQTNLKRKKIEKKRGYYLKVSIEFYDITQLEAGKLRAFVNSTDEKRFKVSTHTDHLVYCDKFIDLSKDLSSNHYKIELIGAELLTEISGSV